MTIIIRKCPPLFDDESSQLALSSRSLLFLPFFLVPFLSIISHPVRSFVRSLPTITLPLYTYYCYIIVRSLVEAKPCLISLASSLFPLASAFQFGPFVQSDETNYRPIENADGRGCVFHFDFVYILGLILHVIHTVYIISFVDLFNPPEKGFFFFMSILFFSIPPCCVFLFVFFSFFFEEEKMKKTPMSFFQK